VFGEKYTIRGKAKEIAPYNKRFIEEKANYPYLTIY